MTSGSCGTPLPAQTDIALGEEHVGLRLRKWGRMGCFGAPREGSGRGRSKCRGPGSGGCACGCGPGRGPWDGMIRVRW